MTVHYKAVRNGKTVWEGTSKEYDRLTIPEEHRNRPKTGVTKLYVDDELIAVQEPIDPDEEAQVVAQHHRDLGTEDTK